MNTKAEYMVALAEIASVRRANDATRAENRAAHRANVLMVRRVKALGLSEKAERAEIRQHWKRNTPLPFRVNAELKAVLVAERTYNRGLKAMTPAEWASRVAQVVNPATRGAVAVVVWWDFFANEESVARWDNLDDLMENASAADVPDEVLEAGLVQVGYAPYTAWRRALTPETFLDSTIERRNLTGDYKQNKLTKKQGKFHNMSEIYKDLHKLVDRATTKFWQKRGTERPLPTQNMDPFAAREAKAQ